ncbi:hydrolase [Nibribacter ruber]|uniref:Hydrolase n=1 Tax=Nibribacter ruber TaxID=2698458 RepID=A0A6P1NX54_9BACT|nr:SGNH/GDSL hydrolase family protein [Nibribacter ruber]QHL87600.1 hydrolase [Nibribacter ruber]
MPSKRSNLLPWLMGVLLFIFFATEGKQMRAAQNSPDTIAGDGWEWHAVQEFGVRGLGWPELEETFTRLPAAAKGQVTDEVWKLSQHSAGVHVVFSSNSKKLKVKWSVRGNNSFNHMAPTVVKGVDLYALGAKGWQWVGVGKPTGKKNEAELVVNPVAQDRKFLLYLPLYDGVDSVSIGVEDGATIKRVEKNTQKPIVFYGTSITQGACASRPGMAYPALVGRQLNRETINLGFSGNGKMEPAMGKLLTDLNPALYVIDCLPNLKPEEVLPKTLALVKTLRERNAKAPILLVENIPYAHEWVDLHVAGLVSQKNKRLQEAYAQLKKEGISRLYYLSNKNLVPANGEGTVDGIHLTDLGFTQLSKTMAKEIKTILARAK